MSLKQNLYCSTLGCRMAYLVKEIMRLLTRRFEEEGIELTIEQFFILNILDNEDGLILKELAKIVDRDKSAVLRHIDGLEKNHFVARATDPEDKRRKLLLVTKPGMNVLEKARAIDRQLDQDISRQIDHIEVAEFEHILSDMYKFAASINNS